MQYPTWRENSRTYRILREQHAAWKLLAATRAPLMLACADALFNHARPEGITLESAITLLAEIFREHANDESFTISDDDFQRQARREWRHWISLGLIIERDGMVLPTDALQKAMAFIAGLDKQQFMTSTASRLATVQREVAHLAAYLNPNQQARATYLRGQIATLQQELAAVESGEMPIMDEQQAAERIGEVYTLAVGLRADFRRVEDSYRDADRRLRESIIRDEYHRGEVVAALLDSHSALIRTAEGQVFQNFHEELRRDGGLHELRRHIRHILDHPAAQKTLTLTQADNLRWLVIFLTKEAERVIAARSRSENDVKNFLRSGLAAEHHRVGLLLKTLFAAALNIDWTDSTIRHLPADLPPTSVSLDNLSLIERLRYKEQHNEDEQGISLEVQHGDLDNLNDTFWQALDGLDQDSWRAQTHAALLNADKPLTIAELAAILPPDPRYDMESLVLWLSIARAADTAIDPAQRDTFTLTDETAHLWQFDVPHLHLCADMINPKQE